MEFYPAFKKKGILTHTTTQDETFGHYAKRNKADVKRLEDSSLDEVPRTVKATVKKVGWWMPGVLVGFCGVAH